jgi:hypothetical protein
MPPELGEEIWHPVPKAIASFDHFWVTHEILRQYDPLLHPPTSYSTVTWHKIITYYLAEHECIRNACVDCSADCQFRNAAPIVVVRAHKSIFDERVETRRRAEMHILTQIKTLKVTLGWMAQTLFGLDPFCDICHDFWRKEAMARTSYSRFITIETR